MGIMDKVLAKTESIWEDCFKTDFLTKMIDGSLSSKKFLSYIVQDSLYLRDYLKSYTMAIFKSKTWKQMQTFYSVMGFVNDSENVTRLKYLKDNNMTDDDVDNIEKLPECIGYTDFLIKVATAEDVPEIAMSVMPCMIGYYIVFNKVKAHAPQILDTYYGNLVEDYTSKHYGECCKKWIKFVDSLCENLSSERKEKLIKIFIEGSQHELYFWQMAGRE